MANNRKPLTKGQWEILRILQQFPNYRIYNPSYRAARLVESSESYEAIRTVNYPAFQAIQPWLIQEKSTAFSELYRLDPEAQMTDDWPEIKRQRQREQRETEESIKAEQEAVSARIAADFLGIQPGPYRVEMAGGWPFRGGIYQGDRCIADVSLSTWSTSWEDWNDALKNEQVRQEMKALAEFVNRANQAGQESEAD